MVYYAAVGSANNWWERSPNSGNSNNFCNVNSNGNANNNNASNGNGLAPFGCFNKTVKVACVKYVIIDTGDHDRIPKGMNKHRGSNDDEAYLEGGYTAHGV